MIRAYQETYLSKAQAALGEALDYAVNACGLAGADFLKLFAASSAGKSMENGDPSVIAGKSGIEIAADVMLETTGKVPDAEPRESMDRSAEYWIGWAAAYYQWYSSRSYAEIFRVLPFDDLRIMYHTLHEADVSKFAEIADERMREYSRDTNLKRIRTVYGLTQAALAERSGVTLRSIQMYEQRHKDINKASAETLYRIARVLGCTVEDLIEKSAFRAGSGSGPEQS